MKSEVEKSEDEWQRSLSPEQFHILREKGTEHPFTGKYVSNKRKGVYACAGCGNELFSSEDKYDSRTGWPSFSSPISDDNIDTEVDRSLGMIRIEVLCGSCAGHLGHVFNDGSELGGKHFCINSSALQFKDKVETVDLDA